MKRLAGLVRSQKKFPNIFQQNICHFKDVIPGHFYDYRKESWWLHSETSNDVISKLLYSPSHEKSSLSWLWHYIYTIYRIHLSLCIQSAERTLTEIRAVLQILFESNAFLRSIYWGSFGVIENMYLSLLIPAFGFKIYFSRFLISLNNYLKRWIYFKNKMKPVSSETYSNTLWWRRQAKFRCVRGKR